MATAKFTLRRYNIINDCFRSKLQRYWGIEDLSERLAQHDIEVTTRTIKNDLHDMRHDNELGYHAPIRYCALNRGYHYNESDYSIDKPRLTMHDLERLAVLKHLAKAFAGLDCLNGYDTVIDKVLLHCKYHAKDQKVICTINVQNAFDDQLKNMINAVLTAIDEGRNIVFTERHPTPGAEKSFSFTPHQLKIRNGKWYAVGKNVIDGTSEEIDFKKYLVFRI
jgi:predicted DNA-binding transcriptional regulator YafY